MRPSDNAIMTARIIWRDARKHNTRDDWRNCRLQFGGIALYLQDQNEADHDYFIELRDAAADMMMEGIYG